MFAKSVARVSVNAAEAAEAAGLGLEEQVGVERARVAPAARGVGAAGARVAVVRRGGGRGRGRGGRRRGRHAQLERVSAALAGRVARQRRRRCNKRHF